MLKLLLGHWKDHRRKPSLLPEDVDLPSNEASRINPIFEDSEGSVTSSHHPHSEIDPSSTEENNTPPAGTSGDVNLDLVDISTPPRLKSESEEAINHINRVLEDALDGESLRSSDHLKIENEAKDEESTPRGAQEVKNVVPPAIAQLIKQASTVNQQQVEAKSASEELVEPPPDPTAAEPKEPVPEPLTKTEKVQREELAEMVPGTSLKTQQSDEPVSASSSAETTKVMDSAPPVDNSKETEIKSANLKTRAIDELIKKFQGQKSDVSPGLQTVSSFLHSPNRKDVGKVRSPLFKNEIKKTEAESEPKKESLSTIFKFPPPPPLETKDPKDDLKVTTKTENSQPIPKVEKSSAEKTQGTTRSDSSLSRNITVSSKDTAVSSQSNSSKPVKETKPDSITNTITRSNDSPKLKASKPEDPKPVKETKSNSTTNSLTKSSSSILKASSTTTNLPSTEPTPKKETAAKVVDQPPPKSASITAEKMTTVTQVDPKPDQASNQSTSSTESIIASLIKKDTKPQSSALTKQKIEKQTKFFQKNHSDTLPSTSKHQDPFNNTLKTSSTLQKNTEETNPEGVTRGDQVSDESSADPLKSSDPLPKPFPPKSKHPTKEKKSVHHKACKHCKRSKEDISTSFKRGQCEDYYDVITGKRCKSPKSESFGSDLSWEEKELIRKLRRSKRSPSVKSRHSRPRDSGRFRRHHPLRRSMSEDSTLNGGSVCSCDQCWLFLVKDYAHGRASLRTMPANHQLMCTCRPVRPEFLGRKVQFRSSDTIHEGSQSGATSATPTIPEESKKGEESAGEPPTSDSNLSSVSKAKEHKRSKHLSENYRLVTPWELEEWDLAMRKHLLMKRRKRARYMVFMALAMVVFIGLIVTILMIYLRRKTL